MKVPDNKISSVKTYFFEALDSLPISQVRNYFNFLCLAWLDVSKSEMILNPHLEISESEILKFLYGIKELRINRPVQYVAGKTWFYNLEIKVREGVLIPRPETEELVSWIIQDCRSATSILDLGTGSGCIPLAIKNNLKSSVVYGFDISQKALEIAEENSDLLGLEIQFRQFDILNWELYPQENKFDAIVSNPPYIPISDKKMMQKNVLDYEPDLALFVSNDDPLVFYKSIAQFAYLNLNPSGKLFLEIHESYGCEIIEVLKDSGFDNIQLRQDLQGKDRMVKAVLS
ncbi:MAG: protein-(glutamine-N5) methyltransferase, release factor-specific [Flavobacteriales bacterium]|nr:protein-(glutamine-N5) methyltransferase, release factor-specific [Flavobacteriales bacterium]|tara:strand:+ start:2797 stop:3657 length:861 start_codon:yes stop_codon:yes gene_type:complete